MRFARPEFLNFLFLLFPISILFIWGLKSKFKIQNKWKTSKLKHVSRFSSRTSEILAYGIALLVLGLIILALARPQVSYKKPVIIETHLDIVCLIDLSRSMNALDVYQGDKKTVRLELVKKELRNFTERHIGKDKNQVALIAFASKALYRCFFTYDLNTLLFHIDYLDVKDFPPEGTDFGRAIGTGLGMLDLIDNHPDVFKKEQHKRAFILISDGEDFGEYTDQVVIEASKRGIPIYTIGVGSKKGGPII
ncbi:MAG: vWA domain-containing protein, partial [Elusimicrobiota bacterium]